MQQHQQPQQPQQAKGKVGLVNLGNTCFLNAVIQSLRYCTDFTNYFLSGAYESHLKNDRPTAAIVEETADVFKGMWNGDVRANASMAPRGFVASSSRISAQNPTFEELFRGGHEDSSEALNFVLDSIHEGVSRKVKMDVVGTPKSQEDSHQIKALNAWAQFYATGYSPVIENFFGQTMTLTVCKNCNNTNSRFEPWMMIKAPINKNSDQSLTSCVEKAFDKEILSDYQCDKCKVRGQTHLENTISKLPPTLIVSLKRFDNNNNKISTKIDVDLDKTDFRKWISFPSVAKHISTEYSVFAAIEHHGGSRGGHYISFVKHDNSWICYDDQQIREVSLENVINNDTYVLFMTRLPYKSPEPIYTKVAEATAEPMVE